MVKNNRQLKVVYKWVGLGRVQSFMLILGRVGLGHFTCGLGRVKIVVALPHLQRAPSVNVHWLFHFIFQNSYTHLRFEQILRGHV